MLCPYCPNTPDPALAERLRVLQWLALVEHPEALPAGEKLRLCGEVLAWLEQSETGPRCGRYPAAVSEVGRPSGRNEEHYGHALR